MWFFKTSIRKALIAPEYRTYKTEIKVLLKEFPESTRQDIVRHAYANTRAEFQGDKGDRIIEFWICVSVLIDVVFPLYFKGL